MNMPDGKKSTFDFFKAGLIGGIGWAIGVTLGFGLISAIAITILDKTSIVPVIGEFVAEIVDYTQIQLDLRNPYYQGTEDGFQVSP